MYSSTYATGIHKESPKEQFSSYCLGSLWGFLSQEHLFLGTLSSGRSVPRNIILMSWWYKALILVPMPPAFIKKALKSNSQATAWITLGFFEPGRSFLEHNS